MLFSLDPPHIDRHLNARDGRTPIHEARPGDSKALEGISQVRQGC